MNTETLAYICSHVFDKSRPVRLVCRADGDWQFLCGSDHEDGELPLVAGLNHVLDEDPTLHEIMDLESDWEAERAARGNIWVRQPIR